MREIVLYTTYFFCYVLEGIVFLYFLTELFPFKEKAREIISDISYILLNPIRTLIKKSVIKNYEFDFSPIIAFMIIAYMKQILESYI